MSSFLDVFIGQIYSKAYNLYVSADKKKTRTWKRSAAKLAMRYAQSSSDGYLRSRDLKGVSPTAAAKALSRLASQGDLLRVEKGLYYMPREGLLGKVGPSEVSVVRERLAEKSRPTGVTAANLLGLTTQVAARPELAVYASTKPKGVGTTRVTLRKRASAEKLDDRQAAVLETLRNGGRFSELDAEETVRRTAFALFPESSKETPHKTLLAALSEPPRVRAILGALLQNLGTSERVWSSLRESLNPLSKFDFGLFKALPNAKEWQAK